MFCRKLILGEISLQCKLVIFKMLHPDQFNLSFDYNWLICENERKQQQQQQRLQQHEEA
eukprot:m.125837 g.125837  ORF g.125837 m.125837 type:complete len:59 (+) comp14501_c1_seq2:1097-1273(+)